jgi:hypothetical protein
LFEPSLWRPPTDQDVPQTVPAPDRAHLSTPCGLLLNELVHAPGPLLDALHVMLSHAAELDTGRWTTRAAAVILYVVRLVVRVDAFITLLVRFNTCDHGTVNGTGWASSVRGLKASDDAIAACVEKRALLRQVLQLQIAPILERWRVFALKAKDMHQVAVLHAHTCFLWRNVEQEDLTEAVVVSLLSSQLILSSRFRPSSWSTGNKDKGDVDDLDESELLLPAWELVALQQAKRGMLLRWLDADAQRKNQALEKVVAVVAMATCGPNNRTQARHWRSIDGRHCVARFVPCLDQRNEEDQQRAERERDYVRGQEVGEIEVNVQLGTFSLNRSRLQGVDERMVDFPHFKQLFGDQGHLAQCAAVSITTKRVWMRMVGRRHDLILWKPDERAASAPPGFTRRYPDSLSSSEGWIRTALEQVRNEHDVLNDAQLLLPQNQHDSSAPYARVFGVRLVREETATVLREGSLLKLGGALSNKWNSRWFVLTPAQLCYYESQKHASTKQARGTFMLADIKEVGEVSDGPLELYLITQSGKTLHLRASHIGERDDWIKALAPKTCLVECVVVRASGVVHIFEIFDEGRHKHRRLVFSSDPNYTMHEMPTLYEPEAATGTLVKLACAATGGAGPQRDFRVPRASQSSLIITRNLGNRQQDKQTLVPPRLLQGLLPDALLDDFQFWQRPDLSLVGYQHVALRSRLQTAAVLRITVQRCGNAQAQALVQRVPLHNAVAGENVSAEQQWEEEEQLGAAPRDVVTLLDLVHAPQGALLYRLGRMLARLDSLSHVLVWTKAPCTQAGEACSVDLIELPRLQLTLQARTCPDGILRLQSASHAGMYVSDAAAQRRLSALLQGLPHGVLLESLEGDLAVLTPACLPARDSTGPWSFLSTRLQYQHARDASLLGAMSVRQYLYPVHLSKHMLFTQTLASALNLVLLRFLGRQYADVFRLTQCCVSDTALSPEEVLLVEQLGKLRSDCSPDAHACRLKLCTVVTGSGDMRWPWDVSLEMLHYLSKLKFVSAACRLTVDEELMLLQNYCTDINYKLSNRQQYLRAKTDCSSAMLVQYPARADLNNSFDAIVDKSCLASDSDGILSKFDNVSYRRPQESVGIATITALNKWLSHGLKVRGGRDDLGFLFLYELLTSTISIRILPHDSPHNLGSLLIRLLPDKEWQQRSALMSVLRVMSRNPSLCTGHTGAECPKVVVDGGSNMSIMSMMFKGLDNAYSRTIKEVLPYMVRKRDQIEWHAPDYLTVYSLPNTAAVDTAPNLPRNLLTATSANFACALRFLRTGAVGNDMSVVCGRTLEPIGLDAFIVQQTREQQGLQPVSATMPYDLSAHPAARSHIARTMLKRLTDDAAHYSQEANGAVDLKLRMFLDTDLDMYVDQPQGKPLGAAMDAVARLVQSLRSLHDKDSAQVEALEKLLCREANKVPGDLSVSTDGIRHSLARLAQNEPLLGVEHVMTALLSTDAVQELTLWNPFLDASAVHSLLDTAAMYALHMVRLGHVRRCLAEARDLMSHLTNLRSLTAAAARADPTIKQEIALKADLVASSLSVQRIYMLNPRDTNSTAHAGSALSYQQLSTQVPPDGACVMFDPRFLVFEYLHNVMLRQQQV